MNDPACVRSFNRVLSLKTQLYLANWKIALVSVVVNIFYLLVTVMEIVAFLVLEFFACNFLFMHGNHIYIVIICNYNSTKIYFTVLFK